MQRLLFALLVGALTFITFNHARQGGLVWSDQENSAITGPSHESRNALIRNWSEKAPQSYTPVPQSLWILTKSFGANSPAEATVALHTLSVAMHALISMVVFLILSLLFPSLLGALLGTLLFAVHPLQVEAVAYLSTFNILCAAFFGFITLWQYIALRSVKKSQGREPKRYTKRIGLIILTFTLALLSHPAMAVLPLIAVALETLLPENSAGMQRRRSTLGLGIICLCLAVVTVFFALRWHDAGSIARTVAPWQRPFIAGDALAFYLVKLLAPLNIGPDYGRSPGFVLTHWWGYATWALPLAIGGLALAWQSKGPARTATRPLLGGYVIFILGLLPFLGLFAFANQATSTVASHYVYLAMLGPAVALTSIVALRRPKGIFLIAALAIMACAHQSYQQIFNWRDNDVLWRHALKINPSSPIAHRNIADQFRKEGQWEKARDHYEKVLMMNPHSPESLFHLADLERRIGNMEKASTLYHQVLDLDDKFVLAHSHLGLILLEQGKVDEALKRFEFVVGTEQEIDPQTLYHLGRAYFLKKSYGEATGYIKKALNQMKGASAEELASLHALLGLSYLGMGESQVADTQFAEALRLNPEHPEAHRARGDLYYQNKDFDSAEIHYKKALKTFTSDARILQNLGAITASQKRYKEAALYLQSAMQLDKDNAEVVNMLGVTQFHLRNFEEARKNLLRAMELNPNLADPYYYIGDMARWAGKQPEAFASYYKALKIDPDHSGAHYRLGHHFLSTGRMQEAMRHFHAALKKAPEDPKIISSLRKAERHVQASKI